MNEPHSEETIVVEVLRLPPAERSAYLDLSTGGNVALRQRVESLLLSYQAGDFLEQAAAPVLQRTIALSVPLTEKAGDKIGRYKLLQQIGEGGCGVVYMAEQEEPVRRRVALKIIKAGMDTKSVIARFEAERQALALMDHPNIAKVFDAGATETGRPYFVMELVRGMKITDYCDEAKLPFRARLELFMQVCHAIQHAHQKGIIHRDIKPSNILVTINDGLPVPKVIDFGIAKATNGQQFTDKTVFTAFEQFIGTPAYMSPEQAMLTSLDIDTRSDIYSLGVLLYELLTGKTPFESAELLAIGLDEMRRTIREKEPDRPSTRLSTLPDNELGTTAQSRGLDAPKLISQLRGDLDWIVMKALDKDRARRYETANGLAMDIERHLNEEPVLARPPGNVYRLRKLVRRNKGVFAAASLIIATLILGSVVSTALLLKERAARRRAIAAEFQIQQALAEARQQRDEALKQKLRADNQAAATKTENDILLKDASAWVGTWAALAQWNMGTLKDSTSKLGPDHPVTLISMHDAAVAYRGAGQLSNALPLFEEVARRTKAVLGPDHLLTVRSLLDLAGAYRAVGRLGNALPLFEEVLAFCIARLGPDNPETIESMTGLAQTYWSVGRNNEAIALIKEVLGVNPEDSEVLLFLATWQTWLGQDADYEATRRRMFQNAEETKHASTAERAAKVACLRPSSDAALLAKALNFAQRAVELGKNSDPWNEMTLGLAEYRNGQYAAAEQTLTIAEQTVGKLGDSYYGKSEIQGTVRLFHAMSLFRQGKLEDARRLFNEARAQMTPPPKDENQPPADGKPNNTSYNDLIWWMAYKEAKALIESQSSSVKDPHQ